jgi:two-component system chemotaxis sensor kinase CheA
MTTAIELSDLSGRGVGLDIVRTNIECELAGDIHISSELGVGTEITLLIPNSRTSSGASFDDATQCLFSAVTDPEDARS